MERNNRADYRRFLDPAVVSKLSALELKARLIVEGFLLGLHRSPYHGFSIEFSQHRPYIQGDSLKDVDWKVYGKTDRFFVKQYEEETNLKCYILLDISRSMQYSSEGRIPKLEYASLLAASLTYLMLKQQDAVGLMLYSDEIKKYLPPKASNLYLGEILRSLESIPDTNVTNTAASLKKLAEKINRRGMVIVISDFFDDLSSVTNALKHFGFNKNEVIIFQILDPVEREFAFHRDSVFTDMETGEKMTTQPHQIKKAYRVAMETFLKSLKRECLNNRIDYNLIETSMPFDKALYSYLQKRSRLN